MAKWNWYRYAWVALVVVALGAAAAWWKFLHSEPQVFATSEARFRYGSLGGDIIAGMPYPIFMILPRVFPDLIERYATERYGSDKPGWGGYSAFGLPWEQGQRLPVGLSIRRVGFERVTVNCSVCHTATYRTSPEAKRIIVTGGPGHTVNVQGLLHFLFAASHDARFTAARLLPEMAVHFPLDWLDWKIYSFILIPKVRLALHLLEGQLAWMEHRPAWGPGRDDAFNLPKFILLQQHWDASVSSTDFPALWQLAEREGTLFHAAGEAKTLYAVTATSAFGAGSPPDSEFRSRNEWLDGFIGTLQAPKYPSAIDAPRAVRGRAIYAGQCAMCHAKGGQRTGTLIPLAEIGTDPQHVKAWTEEDARHMNRLTRTLGITGTELQSLEGYVAKPLVGVWLLGPYLHNGSVPTLTDLLSPSENRPAIFYRGYDVLDPENGGFVSVGAAAAANGFRFDTGLKGNGNGGHAYGTDLAPDERRDLIEYLKTL